MGNSSKLFIEESPVVVIVEILSKKLFVKDSKEISPKTFKYKYGMVPINPKSKKVRNKRIIPFLTLISFLSHSAFIVKPKTKRMLTVMKKEVEA